MPFILPSAELVRAPWLEQRGLASVAPRHSSLAPQNIPATATPTSSTWPVSVVGKMTATVCCAGSNDSENGNGSGSVGNSIRKASSSSSIPRSISLVGTTKRQQLPAGPGSLTPSCSYSTSSGITSPAAPAVSAAGAASVLTEDTVADSSRSNGSALTSGHPQQQREQEQRTREEQRSTAGPPKSDSELELELRQRWKHLQEPQGPGPFPELGADPQTPTWTSPVWASAIDIRRHIFCNRSLNMESIVAVGFDMDYTLVQYRADTFEALAYKNCIQKLVNRFGYPNDLLTWTFDWRYMVRGLVLDKKRGNILKMDRHKYVKVAYHGFRSLTNEDRGRLYNSTRARESFDEPDYALIDTLFSLAEAYLFAQLVDWCDAFPHRSPPEVVAPGTKAVNYEVIYKNVRSAVDLCHRDGSLKSAVAADPRLFLHRDEQIVPMIRMLRESGRKTFLVTNSLWDYTHVVMNCIVGNDGTSPETARNYDWLKLFDVVITGSAKPGFFQDSNRAPVFEVDVASGMLFNTDEGSPAAQIGDLPMPTLKMPTSQACQVFQGGNVGHLHRLLHIASGSQVMYVGDHIYGDILRSKKTLGWRTMLVVPELVREIHVLQQTSDLQKAFHKYKHQIESLDDTLQRMAWALRFDHLSEEKQQEVTAEMEHLKVQRDAAKDKYRAIMDEWHSHFHPIWGMLMKTGYQNSRFAHQVERFACLYTSHVANLAYYSPDKNYRTVEDFMPHEIDILD